jgi:hypothetical protein
MFQEGESLRSGSENLFAFLWFTPIGTVFKLDKENRAKRKGT